MVSERGPLSETREEDFQHRGAWAKSRGEENFCAKFEIFEFFPAFGVRFYRLPDSSGGTVQIAGRPCRHSMVVLA